MWAGVGLIGALIAIALTGAAVSFFSGDTPEREVRFQLTLLTKFYKHDHRVRTEIVELGGETTFHVLIKLASWPQVLVCGGRY